MADPFVAEVRIFGFNFAPTGWALCDGQILPISQNTALFALLGTMYGGDGKSTFALPDLQGSACIHRGQGQGLSIYDEGQTGGEPSVSLLQSEMPFHTHTLNASYDTGTEVSPNLQYPAVGSAISFYDANNQPTDMMAFNVLTIAGGSQPHNNYMPTLTLNFCIALQGVFPPRG